MGVLALLALSGVARAQSPKSRYSVKDLGTLGGSYSFAYAINASGAVVGGAATENQTDFFSQTAFLSYGGQPINLGTLGGLACPGCSSEGAAASANGTVAILSETAKIDADGQDFCGFGTNRQCLAAAWKNGILSALPTLAGGNNSQAYFVNNQGEIIGLSENSTYDATCRDSVPFHVHRLQAVKWGLDGKPVPLAPLPGDTVSFGFGINNIGQAVGTSGLCATTTLPPNYPPGGAHAVLWEADGSPVDLGSLPGNAGINVATSINNSGEVVGQTHLLDGTVRSFLWSRTTGMRDLGTFPDGALLTVAGCCHTINDSGQIVGFSIDSSFNMRALLWQNGAPTDLNALIPADSPWYLLAAASINDAGEIVGWAVNINSFEVHAFLASPNSGVGPAARGTKSPPALPQKVRAQLRRQLHF
jgi:probable HAF family extracellular repeat protein